MFPLCVPNANALAVDWHHETELRLFKVSSGRCKRVCGYSRRLFFNSQTQYTYNLQAKCNCHLLWIYNIRTFPDSFPLLTNFCKIYFTLHEQHFDRCTLIDNSVKWKHIMLLIKRWQPSNFRLKSFYTMKMCNFTQIWLKNYRDYPKRSCNFIVFHCWGK